jgi:hypothetical protein
MKLHYNLNDEHANTAMSVILKAMESSEISLERAIELARKINKEWRDAELIGLINDAGKLTLAKYDPAYYPDIGSDYYYESTKDFVEVHRSNGTSFWCPRRSTYNVSFRCERSDKHFYNKEFRSVYCDSWAQWVCFEKYEHLLNHINGKYTTSSIDDENENENGDLPEYHSLVRPSWWKTTEGIGMELEINCDEPEELAHNLPKDILGESDGSLGHKGIELIGGPYTLEQYQEGKTPWNDTLQRAKSIGASGFHAGTGYGIHLSISRSLFTTLHAAKFIVFFNQQSDLVKMVAQRDTIYSGKYGKHKKLTTTIKRKVDINSYNPETKRFGDKKMTVGTGKYEPVFADDSRLEVRVFRSNISWERILKNIEFVQAVFDFTRNDATIDNVADATNGTPVFLKWLSTQSKYRQLKNFLNERKNNKSSVNLEAFTFKPKTPSKDVPSDI